MPAKSSSSATTESTATTKSSTRRRSTSRSRTTSDNADVTADDDATQASNADDAPATEENGAPTRRKRTPTRKRRTRKSTADLDTADEFGAGLTESSGDADERPARGKRPARKRRRSQNDNGSAAEADTTSTEASGDDFGAMPAEDTDTSRGRSRKSSARSDDDSPTNAPSNTEPGGHADQENADLTDLAEKTTERTRPSRDQAEHHNNRSQGEGRGRRQTQANDDSGGDRSRRRRRRRRRGGSGDEGGGPNNRRGGGGGGGRQQNQQRGRNSSRRTRSHQHVNDEVTGTIEGVLELHPKEYGFLRDPKRNYAAQDSDAFVSSSFIQKHGLRAGVLIRGDVGPGTKGQGPRLKSIESIDGRTLEEYKQIRHFDELTPVNPYEQIKLETGPRPVTMRVMDLLTPIGKGQRALIVAPPRTGKTMLLHDIAHAVSENHPEMTLIVLLIDERPEEVTEIRRNVNGEVIASSMDRDVESHVRLSQLITERGKRLAEAGAEVFILLDSITRTARAFNKWVGNSVRTGSGGLDVKAMDIPRKIFGTARRFEEGGSLTILATALIDTGSRMDDAIFQEFKGTGNMELMLSRDLADRRIWPAIDISRSGTRREEKILDPETLDVVTLLRRSLVSLSPNEAMEELTRKLEMFPTNAEFLQKIRNVL